VSRSHDGRNIATNLGTMEGEGAQQRVKGAEAAAPMEGWKRPADESLRSRTYYERPVLKEPVWIWAIPAYFHAGGVAGAAAVLGAAAQAGGRDRLSELVKTCRRLSLASILVGTGLLIYDLGRPERFLNMLRVFRPTSPMSVGSWVLAGAGPTAAVASFAASSDGALRRVGDGAGLGLGILGLPLAGYTAVLVSNSAVPVWQETRRTLPLLFLASAASSAAAALQVANLSDEERRVVDRFGLVADVAELAATFAVEREASRAERVGRPLREGVSGTLWKLSTACTLGTLALSVLPRRGKLTRVGSSIVGTAGSLALRFAVLHAGKASAGDPRATFEHQRNASERLDHGSLG
jgi:formate-dependent nitrite reductase membrane component NrfD